MHRLLSEERLGRTGQRHRLLAEHVHDVIWAFDLEARRLTYVSPSVEKLLGFGVEEALELPLDQLLTPESLVHATELLDRLAAGKDPSPYTAVLDQRGKDGRVRHVEITAGLIRDGDRAVEVVGVSRDATERVGAERALAQRERQLSEVLAKVRESQERFQALIERSSDMIQVLDERGRYVFWSQNAQDEVGWAPDEMVGTDMLDLVHEEDRPRMAVALERLLASPGAIHRFAYRFRHRDGSWRQAESVARNLLHDPCVKGVVINTRDVTEQRHLEEQLRQAQKLDSVGRLAGGVAHDFNNILTVILSCADALKGKLAAADVEGQEDLEEIRAAGERARDLTQQLLAFARKQIIAPVPLQLNEVVRRNQKMLARLLGEDVTLHVELHPGLGAIHADPGQVDQVLMNLAVNARDAMPRGGTLSMTTRNQAVPAGARAEGNPPPGDWVQLVVRDTGTGMSPEVRAHLFEPFFTTKEQGKGTGLGLATVYGIVVQAGGHIQVLTGDGAGTTFEISFPRSAEVEAPPPALAEPRRARGTERILVVEDDPLVRGVVVRTLSSEGYQVSALGHPRHALELSLEELHPVRLLVSDVIMPGLDGPTLARELTGRHPALRVLYLSGYTRDAISERSAIEKGAEFLAKPFARSALLAKVRSILDAG